MNYHLTSQQAAELLDAAPTAEAAVELLGHLERDEPWRCFYADHNEARALELLSQPRLNAMWLLGPEARKAIIRATWGQGPEGGCRAGYLARLSDEAILATIREPSDEDESVLYDVLALVVATSRAVLYPDIVRVSDRFRGYPRSGYAGYPSWEKIDPQLGRLLALQALDRVQAGEEVERELRFVLSYGWAFLEDREQKWLAEHFPGPVTRAVGYHYGLPTGYHNPEQALAVLREAGFDDLGYKIFGETTCEEVVAHNRLVTDLTARAEEIPDDALLIKEGFGWEVDAAELWPGFTTGGTDLSRYPELPPEYNVSVALQPRRWVYYSRSGKSHIEYRRESRRAGPEPESWSFTGYVSLACLCNLVAAGIDPTVEFGTAKFPSSRLLKEAEEARESAPSAA